MVVGSYCDLFSFDYIVCPCQAPSKQSSELMPLLIIILSFSPSLSGPPFLFLNITVSVLQ